MEDTGTGDPSSIRVEEEDERELEGYALVSILRSSPPREWIQAQETLKAKLIQRDDFSWAGESSEKLKYIGGVDLSFSKQDPCLACAALVVVDAQTLDVVHQEFELTRLTIPYVPGFLAFREAPILLALLHKMKERCPSLYPQLLMVDGNGVLHPRGFGMACHLGVLIDHPTIGVGKSLHHVDGLTWSGVKQLLGATENLDLDTVPLIGHSGQVWGAAVRSSTGSSKPIFVSVGHRISLGSAVRIVKTCCKFCSPEPIRQVMEECHCYSVLLLRGESVGGAPPWTTTI